MDQPVSRRAWISGLVTSAGAVASVACNTAPGVTETMTADGRVLQWEGDELIVLVSGLRDRYPVGESVRVNVLINNQSTRTAQVRVRTRILGRADQAVQEIEPALLDVRPDEATGVDRDLPLARSLVPGEYQLSVEIPPWRVDGRETGRLITIRARFQVERAP